ncbi:uroporphyrinogen-III synthase [Luteipulveratus halotolerans]|nr:uroporphyrinogen-III synthase [Luteipulveratus halotolerans]
MSSQLAGSTVVLTAQRRANELAAALERRGAEVVHAPSLSVVPHVDDPELIARTRELLAAWPDVVVVTTGVGFLGWVEAADAAGLQHDLMEMLTSSRIIARGPKARGALQAQGLTADWVAESETSAEIQDLLLTEGVHGQRIAIQHHGAGADGLDEAFALAGADVCSLVVYRWGPAPDPAAVRDAVRRVAARACDAVVFTSAPGATAFIDVARTEGVLPEVVAACNEPDGVVAAAVGTVTSAPLETVGIRALVPDRFRLGALVRALVRELAERRGLRVLTPRGELRVLRGAAVLDGDVLALSPGSLAALRVLALAQGGVVSRGDILAALPGGSSDLHTAEVAVARLREGLGSRDLVATVVKRGYRLAVADGEDG